MTEADAPLVASLPALAFQAMLLFARLGAARCSAAHLAGRALDLDAAIAIADAVLERHAAGGRSRIPARPI